jgi:hypothetical protein
VKQDTFLDRFRLYYRDARDNGHTLWWSLRWGLRVAWALR